MGGVNAFEEPAICSLIVSRCFLVFIVGILQNARGLSKRTLQLELLFSIRWFVCAETYEFPMGLVVWLTTFPALAMLRYHESVRSTYKTTSHLDKTFKWLTLLVPCCLSCLVFVYCPGHYQNTPYLDQLADSDHWYSYNLRAFIWAFSQQIQAISMAPQLLLDLKMGSTSPPLIRVYIAVQFTYPLLRLLFWLTLDWYLMERTTHYKPWPIAAAIIATVSYLPFWFLEIPALLFNCFYFCRSKSCGTAIQELCRTMLMEEDGEQNVVKPLLLEMSAREGQLATSDQCGIMKPLEDDLVSESSADKGVLRQRRGDVVFATEEDAYKNDPLYQPIPVV